MLLLSDSFRPITDIPEKRPFYGTEFKRDNTVITNSRKTRLFLYLAQL